MTGRCLRSSLSTKFSLFRDEPAFLFLVEAAGKLACESDGDICVVGIIGKSSRGFRGNKAAVVDQAIGRKVFTGLFGDEDHFCSQTSGCDIEGYYDEQNRVVFLHLISPLDTDVLLELSKRHHRDIREKGFHKFFNEAQGNLIKSLLLIFLVSHIVVIVQPSIHFDLNYLPLLQLVESSRLKHQHQVTEFLSEIGDLPSSWIDAGRPCSPRLLFLFESQDLNQRIEVLKRRRKYELLLEDQIYRFLRRSRIITNICANSLCAVCNQMNFVFISTTDSCVADSDAFFMQMLLKFCGNSNNGNIGNQIRNSDLQTSQVPDTQENDEDEEHTFYNFLWSHLIVAQTKGFDDNVGRHNVIPVFERPKVGKFFELLKGLRDLLFEPNSLDGKSLEDNLRNLIDSEDDEEDDYVDEEMG